MPNAEFSGKVLSKLEWCGQGFKKIHLQRRSLPVDWLTWQSFCWVQEAYRSGPCFVSFQSPVAYTTSGGCVSCWRWWRVLEKCELVAIGKRLSDEKRKWCKLIFQVSLLYFVLLRSGTKHDYIRRKENGRKKNFPRQKTTEQCVLVLKKIFQSSFQVNVTWV